MAFRWLKEARYKKICEVVEMSVVRFRIQMADDADHVLVH